MAMANSIICSVDLSPNQIIEITLRQKYIAPHTMSKRVRVDKWLGVI